MYTKVQADNANKVVQFLVKENAHSVSIATDAGFTADMLDNSNIKVELVMSGKMNQTLFSYKYATLKKVLAGFFPKLQGLIPFAYDKSLILNDNAYLQITLDYAGQGDITDFSYAINRFIENTDVPLVIKKKTVATSEDIDTEFYPIVLIPGDVVGLETVIMSQDDNGQMWPQKVSYSRELIKSSIDAGQYYLPIFLQNNQKVHVDADNSDIFLLQVN